MSTRIHTSKQSQKSYEVSRWKRISRLYPLLKPLALVSLVLMLILPIPLSHLDLPATADLMFALISTEELEDLNQIMVKQLKNRYNDPTINKRFVIGIDRAKMRLYDCEQKAQNDIVDSKSKMKSIMRKKVNLKSLLRSLNFNAHT